MKTLLQLAHQYKGDVEQRIKCLEFERDNLDEILDASYHQGKINDCNSQIAHWEATLKQIDKVLAKYDEAITIKLISALYEWVCPDCNVSNKGSSIDGGINCSGCGKTFKINFGGK